MKVSAIFFVCAVFFTAPITASAEAPAADSGYLDIEANGNILILQQIASKGIEVKKASPYGV